MRIGRKLFIGILCSTLFGCSLFAHKSKYPPLEPASVQLHVGRVWMGQTGHGVGETALKLIPAVSGQTIVFANADGTVSARDRITGVGHWHVDVDRPITSSPGVGDNRVYVGTQDGKIVALDLESGKRLWKVKVSNQVLAAPQYSQGLVIVKTINGELIALDAETGEIRWSYVESLPRLLLRGDSAPVIASSIVVSGFADGNLVALTLDHGKLAWEKKVVQPSGFSDLARMIDIDADPIIVDDVVYVVSYQGNISAINLRSSEILWQRSLSSHTGIAVSGSDVFVTDTHGRLWSFNRSTGAVNWRQTQFETRQLTAPAVIGDYVVVADDEGFIHWMAQQDGHSVARQFFSESGVIAPPVVEGDLLYVVSRDGNAVALNPRLENSLSEPDVSTATVALPAGNSSPRT